MRGMTKAFPPVPPSDPAMDPENFWVFGYGSLMWRPGFDFTARKPALLEGFSRDMCLTSIHYRGTQEKPGMVCGLSPGGSCHGLAFRIAPANVTAVIAYLDERELISYIYLPRHLPIMFDNGTSATARTYLPDATHVQFAGHWPPAEKARHIAQGTGSEGTSIDYLANIVSHLHELGISDAKMESLLAQARALT
jgi:glutathione-specific gamma-glutamylcyclotransferase